MNICGFLSEELVLNGIAKKIVKRIHFLDFI